MAKILLSGFAPFGGHATNPTERLMHELAGMPFAGAEIRTLVLPVVFRDSFPVLAEAIRDFRPDLVLATGLAEKRRHITPEARAVNLIDARIPDTAGRRPVATPIRPGGPATLAASLDNAAIVAALARAGIPARISESAGEYVCNYLMYELLDHAAEHGYRAGFIHVPPLKEMAADGWDFETLRRGMAAAVQEAIGGLRAPGAAA